MPFDLDVDSPEKVLTVLREAADKFYEAQVELSTSWQDKQAGRIWSKIAVILESAADKIEKKVGNRFAESTDKPKDRNYFVDTMKDLEKKHE